MVLESTVICIDNSEFMRNGDYLPTRIQAQQDAANLVCRTKLRANPENTVALLSLSDVKVHVTLTADSGKLLSKLHLVQPKGNIKFIHSVRVAQLALKHRQGKNHRMRIVIFVGSPIEEDEKEIIKLAKKLKKEKVNVEVVNFGEESLNTEKLSAFIDTLNGKDGTGCHLVNIPPGSMLSDALLNSPICAGEGAVPSGDSGFDFDPNTDPELALALRVSLEEQRHRQEEESRKPASEDGVPETQSAPATAGAAQSDDEMLRTALAMSMGQNVPSTAPAGGRGIVDISQMTEEEQIAYALQMSVQDEESSLQTPMDTDIASPVQPSGDQDMDADYPDDDEDDDDVISDPAFLQSVLQNLPGVDASSEAVQQAMNQLTGQQSSKDEDKDSKKDKK